MVESEVAVHEEIEALKAIWPELEDRPPVWNSPAIAVPVYPLGKGFRRLPLQYNLVCVAHLLEGVLIRENTAGTCCPSGSSER